MECFIILHVTFKIIGFSKQETIDKWLDWLKQYLQERENSNGKRLLILDGDCMIHHWRSKRTNLSMKDKMYMLCYCHFNKVIFLSFQCRLIVNCMSQTRCQAYNWLLTPLIAIVIGVCTMRLGVIEVYLLYAYNNICYCSTSTLWCLRCKYLCSKIIRE